MVSDFKFTLTILDEYGNKAEELDLNSYDLVESNDNNVLFYLGMTDDGDPSINVSINNIDNMKNKKMILKATHVKTQKSIEKNLYIVKEEDKLKGTVNITGTPIEGRTLSAEIAGLPGNIEDVRYKWYVKKPNGDYELVQSGISKDLVLKSEYVGADIKVEVEAMNYLDTVTSNEVTVKSNDVAPIINGIQDKEIKAGDVAKFNAGENLDGITGQDSEGNTLTVTVEGQVEIPDAGTNKEFEIKYLVKDKNGYETVEIRKVTVTNQVPRISGLKEIIITEGDSYNVETGVTAEDHEDGTITNIVYPTDDLTKLDAGLHRIKYSVTDSDGNTTEEERTVIVNRKTSLVGPTITGINDIELKVGQVDAFNAGHQLTNVTVSDDIDAPEKIKVTVSGTVGKPAAGTDETYELTYTAVDSDSNTTVEKRNVTVTNRIPTISGLTEITINKGETADVRVGVTANDYEDGEITNIVYPTDDLSQLDVGTHKIKYSVTDSDNNTVELERTVVVEEKLVSAGPEIQGANNITLKVSQVDEFNNNHKLTGVTVIGNVDAGLMPTVSGEVGKPVAGKNEVYELTYTVEDKDGNRREVVRKVTVTNQLPVISGLNAMAVTEGENIDLKSGITVHDFEDGDITNNLVCLTDLNTLTVGENIVQYSVSDADGNIVTGERKVIVLEKEEQKPEEKPEIPSEPEVPSEPEKPSEPGNGVIVNPETNNGTADKNENSSSNNSNNSGNNSIEVNKADVPNTYDGGIGSYILSGIGSLGLLSILNRRKRRK